MTHDTFKISPGSRFRAAMMLAIVADALSSSNAVVRDWTNDAELYRKMLFECS